MIRLWGKESRKKLNEYWGFEEEISKISKEEKEKGLEEFWRV
jgi:hypothetical protein